MGWRRGIRGRRPASRSGGGIRCFPCILALTDEAGQRFVYDERFAREALGMGGASDRGLDVHVDSWWLRGSSPFRMHAASRAGGARSGAGGGEGAGGARAGWGFAQGGVCVSCASHYYSMTRLRTSGTLGVSRGSGCGWTAYRGWTTSSGRTSCSRDMAGWDWFSDSARRPAGDHGLPAAAEGRLAGAGVERVAGRSARRRAVSRRGTTSSSTSRGAWKSPHTGGTYPSGWRVRVPSAGLDLDARADGEGSGAGRYGGRASRTGRARSTWSTRRRPAAGASGTSS